MTTGQHRKDKESFFFTDSVTGRQVLQLTNSWQRSVQLCVIDV